MTKEPNSDIENEEDTKKVAEANGVDLDKDVETEEEKSTSKKKDTETTEKEEDRSGKSEETDKDEITYKKRYSESTKEYQTKYKPMEESIKNLQKVAGKDINEIVKDYEKTEEKIEKKSEKDALPKDEEVTEKVSSLEEQVSSLSKRISDQETETQLSAKKKVDAFKEKYELSDGDYEGKIAPCLNGIKDMTKESGDHYTLEEALEVAYLVSNKDNVDKIVDQKIKIKEKETDMASSPPKRAKESSSVDEGKKVSDKEIEIGRKLGVDLTEEE